MDRFCSCGPCERRAFLIVVLRECLDAIDELPDGLEGTAAYRFLHNYVEPDLDLVEPGCIRSACGGCGNVVFWPARNLLVLVCGVIVHDQVHVKICGNVLVEVIQEV